MFTLTSTSIFWTKMISVTIVTHSNMTLLKHLFSPFMSNTSCVWHVLTSLLLSIQLSLYYHGTLRRPTPFWFGISSIALSRSFKFHFPETSLFSIHVSHFLTSLLLSIQFISISIFLLNVAHSGSAFILLLTLTLLLPLSLSLSLFLFLSLLTLFLKSN